MTRMRADEQWSAGIGLRLRWTHYVAVSLTVSAEVYLRHRKHRVVKPVRDAKARAMGQAIAVGSQTLEVLAVSFVRPR